jgi:membrane protein DedA with SNARE-associated domain
LDSNDSVSKFMGGVFFGTLVAAVIMLLLGYVGSFVPVLARLHSFEQMLISGVIAVVILITRPWLLKTV